MIDTKRLTEAKLSMFRRWELNEGQMRKTFPSLDDLRVYTRSDTFERAFETKKRGKYVKIKIK